MTEKKTEDIKNSINTLAVEFMHYLKNRKLVKCDRQHIVMHLAVIIYHDSFPRKGHRS